MILVNRLFGYLVIWLSGYLVIWLFGYLVIWLSGYLVIWLFDSRMSGVGCPVSNVRCRMSGVGCIIHFKFYFLPKSDALSLPKCSTEFFTEWCIEPAEMFHSFLSYIFNYLLSRFLRQRDVTSFRLLLVTISHFPLNTFNFPLGTFHSALGTFHFALSTKKPISRCKSS